MGFGFSQFLPLPIPLPLWSSIGERRCESSAILSLSAVPSPSWSQSRSQSRSTRVLHSLSKGEALQGHRLPGQSVGVRREPGLDTGCELPGISCRENTARGTWVTPKCHPGDFNSQYYPRKQNKIKQKTNINGHQTMLKFFSMLCIDRYTYFTGEELQEKRKNSFSLVSQEFHSRPQEHSAPPHCIHLASYLHKLLQYKKKKANLTYLRSRFNFMHNYYSHR